MRNDLDTDRFKDCLPDPDVVIGIKSRWALVPHMQEIAAGIQGVDPPDPSEVILYPQPPAIVCAPAKLTRERKHEFLARRNGIGDRLPGPEPVHTSYHFPYFSIRALN
jgi:hypothetical protein